MKFNTFQIDCFPKYFKENERAESRLADISDLQ